MPGSGVKLSSQRWLCSSAGDGPGHAGVYWDRCSLKAPKAGIAGTEDSAYCWVGRKRAKAVICKKKIKKIKKIGSGSQVQSTLSSSSLSQPG